MANQSSHGAPIVYEDRTLFPTPIADDHRTQPPPKTGLSAIGVLLVAVFAAAVAGAIVYFLPAMTTDASTKPPPEEVDTIPIDARTNPEDLKTEEGLRKLITAMQKEDDQKQVDLLKAQVDEMKDYKELASLSAQVEMQQNAVAQQIAAAEAANAPASMLEEFRNVPEAPDLEWRLKQEDTLRTYVTAMREKAEAIETRLDKLRLDRARAQGARDADAKPCAGNVGDC